MSFLVEIKALETLRYWDCPKCQRQGIPHTDESTVVDEAQLHAAVCRGKYKGETK